MDSINQLFSFCMQHNCELHQPAVKVSARAEQVVISLFSWLLQTCSLSPGARREQCSPGILMGVHAPLTMPVTWSWSCCSFRVSCNFYSNYLFCRILSHFRSTMTMVFLYWQKPLWWYFSACNILSIIFSLKSCLYFTFCPKLRFFFTWKWSDSYWTI